MTRNLLNVCPFCRVYDPTWFAHFADCPLRKAPPLEAVAATVAMYRKHEVSVRQQ